MAIQMLRCVNKCYLFPRTNAWVLSPTSFRGQVETMHSYSHDFKSIAIIYLYLIQLYVQGALEDNIRYVICDYLSWKRIIKQGCYEFSACVSERQYLPCQYFIN